VTQTNLVELLIRCLWKISFLDGEDCFADSILIPYRLNGDFQVFVKTLAQNELLAQSVAWGYSSWTCSQKAVSPLGKLEVSTTALFSKLPE
jgi:hypothetical protein